MDTIAMQLPMIQAKPEVTVARKPEGTSGKQKGLFKAVLDKTQSKDPAGVLEENKVDSAPLQVPQDGLPVLANLNGMSFVLATAQMAGLALPLEPSVTEVPQLSVTGELDGSIQALVAGSESQTLLTNNSSLALSPQSLVSLQRMFKEQGAAPLTTSTTATENGALTFEQKTSLLSPSLSSVPSGLQPNSQGIPPITTNEATGSETNVGIASAKSMPFLVESGLEIIPNIAEPAHIDNISSIPETTTGFPMAQSHFAAPPVETKVQTSPLQDDVLPTITAQIAVPSTVPILQNDMGQANAKPKESADKLSEPALQVEVVVGQKLVQVQQDQENTTQDSIFQANHTLSEVRQIKSGDSTFEVLPTAQTTDQHNIVAQVVDRARLYLRPANNSEMVLQLRPEHLGELTLKISVENGLVSAAFHSDNREVRQAIEASLPQLKQELTQQGIKLDNVGVFSGSDQFFDNGQRSTQQQQIPLRKSTREFLQTLESAEEAPVRATEGVDYRV